MRKSPLLYITFGLSVLLWALNFIALDLYLYWTIGWYDIMMHFLGGLTIGALVVWFLNLGDRSLRSFLMIFLYTMIVGIGYEIFEYVNGITFSTQKYPVDTALDLGMDAVGATVAYLIAKQILKFSSKPLVAS